ncbi:MAG: EpsI family protein [Parvularculaceae bacterium]
MANAAEIGTASSRDTRLSAPWRSAIVTFIAVLLPLLAVFSTDVAHMARIWFGVSLYHHAIAVTPISAYLVWRRRDWSSASPAADAGGLIVLAIALAMWLASRASNVAVLGDVALVTGIIGAVIIAFGRELARSWAFALAFLFFMVPFGEELTPALQSIASAAVAMMLNFVGVQTVRDGYMLTTGAGRFEMAESCAGLRFLLAGAMISALVAHLSFSRMRSSALFVGAVLLVAVIANWLRAALAILLAAVTNRKIGLGAEHVVLGWVFYSALIIALVVFARRFQGEQNVVRAPDISRPVNETAPIFAAILPVFAFLYFAFVIAGTPANPELKLEEFSAPGWRRTTPVIDWHAQTGGADKVQISAFSRDGETVQVTLGAYAYDRKGAEIASYGVRAADGSDWRIISNSQLNLRGGSVTTQTLLSEHGDKIEVARVYRYHGRYFLSPFELKLRIAADKLVGRKYSGAAIFIAAPKVDSPDATLASFIEDVLGASS